MITSGKGLFSKAPSYCSRSLSALVQEQRAQTGRFLWCTLFLLSLSSGTVVLFGVFPAASLATDIPIASSGVTAVALTVTIPLTIAFLVGIHLPSGRGLRAPVAVGHDCRSLCCVLLFRHPENDPDHSRGESVSSLSAFLSTT